MGSITTPRRILATLRPRSDKLELAGHDLTRRGEQGKARHHAVGVEAVRLGARVLIQIGVTAGFGEGERLKLHAGRVEVLVVPLAAVDAVETTDDKVIDHV